jgi:hypothetical protein
LSQCGVKKEEEKKINPLKIRGKSFLSPQRKSAKHHHRPHNSTQK